MKKDERLLITSTQNPRIRTLKSLQKRRGRDESGLMVIEGLREVRRALSSGIVPVEAYVCMALADDADGYAGYENMGTLGALTKGLATLGTDIFEVNAHVYGKIAYRETSEGVIALAPRPATSIDALDATGTPLILVVDGVEKPGNLGAIIRTADGAGVTGIIVCGGVDVYSPNVIRASVGTVFSMGIAVTGAEEALSWLKKNDIDIITSTPAASLLYHEADYTGACAIVVGSEDKGAGSEWLDPSRIKVRIPMNGLADSLNVSVSAAVLTYEALRQRLTREGRS